MDLFQSWGLCWVFQISWHTECNTLLALTFRIWNSTAGTPSPPLALFVVMLPKAHLTSHSRISGSSWVITLSWLSGSLRPFLYRFSIYSCHLFLISSASIRSNCFCPSVPIFAWKVPFVSLIFLKRSLVFTILLLSSISLHCSLKDAFLSLLSILSNSSFRWNKVESLFKVPLTSWRQFPDGSTFKESACNAGDTRNTGLIPGLWRFCGGGNGNPHPYSCLENLMDRGDWRAKIQRIAKVRHDWVTKHVTIATECVHLYINSVLWVLAHLKYFL